MRKYIIIGLFLAVNIAFAAYNPPPSTFPKIAQVPEAVANMNFGILGGSVPAAPAGCGTCGTNEVFDWQAESTTISDSSGCNAEGTCSISLGGNAAISNDSFTGWPAAGTYSYLSYNGASESSIAVSGMNTTVGTISFNFFHADYGGAYLDVQILKLQYDADDYILVTYYPNSRFIRAYHSGAGSEDYNYTSALVDDTAYSVMICWDSVANQLDILIDDGDLGQAGAITVTALSGAPTTLYIGNAGAQTDDYYIDNIKVYDNVQCP